MPSFMPSERTKHLRTYLGLSVRKHRTLGTAGGPRSRRHAKSQSKRDAKHCALTGPFCRTRYRAEWDAKHCGTYRSSEIGVRHCAFDGPNCSRTSSAIRGQRCCIVASPPC